MLGQNARTHAGDFIRDRRLNPGRKVQISTRDDGVQPRWRGDSKELLYMSTAKLMAVEIKATAESFNHGLPHQSFQSRGDQPPRAVNWLMK